MDRLTRMLTGLLRRLAGPLADGRREWVQALLAEVDDVPPAGSARLAWLGGGLWLVVREAVVNRIIPALAFAGRGGGAGPDRLARRRVGHRHPAQPAVGGGHPGTAGRAPAAGAPLRRSDPLRLGAV